MSEPAQSPDAPDLEAQAIEAQALATTNLNASDSEAEAISHAFVGPTNPFESAPPRLDTASRRRRALRWLRRAGNFQIVLGTGGILLMLCGCLFYPTPYNPLAVNTNGTLQPPSAAHLFGTDDLGRDVLSRMMQAGRTDIPLVIGAALCSMLIGVVIGLLVSTKSKWSERGMRVLDLFQAFPAIVLLIVLVTVAGQSVLVLMVVISIIYGPLFGRLIRAEALAIRESRFMEAAVSIGASVPRQLFRHLLPNVTGIIVVQFALTASRGILILAGLAYLGFGPQPPTPSWGAMISEGQQYLTTGDWWLVIFPGIPIVLVGLFFYQLSLGLETVLGRGSRG
jgi:peptide/nickel transport system permease protein